jgi:hypothetical protein
MWLDRSKPILLVWLGGLLVGVTFPSADASSGQTALEATRTDDRSAESKAERDRLTGIPAPRALRISSGQGKALVYELDPKKERIADPRKGVVGRFRETERGLRWAVVTGVVDHHKISAFLGAGRRPEPPSAERMYRRVDLEKQGRQEDGTWSDWRPVDREANLTILDNLPAIERECVSQKFLTSQLVDPLPWLTDRAWKGVDVEEFLPPERKNREDRRSVPVPAPPPHRAAPPRLMLRALDLTVEPGRSYRYRARIVLANPYGIPVNPRDPTTIIGPWSEATGTVTIPSP